MNERKIKIFIFIILVLILGFFVYRNSQKDSFSDGVGVDTENPNVEARQLCYIWNTEAGDKAQLSMDIREDKVTGEFNWFPAEKDKKTGIFEGSVTPVDKKTMSRTVSALWNTNVEGMMAVEELKIIFGEGTANVGFGEMKDNGKGVFVYTNPKNLSYEPNLSQTDCGDSAMD